MVLGGTLIFVVSSGIGYYGHGVLLDPLIAKFGWSKGAISISVTLYFITAGLMGLITGRQIERYGPKPLLIIGSIVVGFALILMSRISEIWELYAVYLLMAAGWSCTSVMTVSSVITNWFIRRRGMAMGYTMTGLSLGGIIIVPISSYLINSWNLETALPVLGVIYCTVVIPMAFFVMRHKPSDVGQEPDGLTAMEMRDIHIGSAGYSSQRIKWTRLEAMRTLSFWAIVTAFFFALTGQNAYLMHQISFLSKSMGIEKAATAVSITAGASIIGRLMLSSVIDRFDKRYSAAILFFIQSLAVLSLAYIDHVIILYLGTFIFGLTMGNILMMQSLITGECFGMVSFPTISGAVTVFVATGAALGPSIAGFIFDYTGSYQIPFTIFAAMSMVSVITIPFARPPKKAVNIA